MTDIVIIQPSTNPVTVTEDVNEVIVSSVGVQGAKGDTGATGATGASGVVTVNAPLTNAGTPSAADLSVSAGTTSAAGVLQLTDSVASTSTTTAATPAAVKVAYDIAVPKPMVTKSSPLYYKTPADTLSPINVVNSRAYYTPIFIDKTTSFDRIAIRTSTFVGTSTVRLGIYNDTNGKPSTVALDAGTVSCTAATTVYEITISQSLAPGIYWLAFCQQGTAPTTPGYTGNSGSNQGGSGLISGNITVGTQDMLGFYQASVTSAFATATSLVASVASPFVWVRAA
jgi:hypothetical protein